MDIQLFLIEASVRVKLEIPKGLARSLKNVVFHEVGRCRLNPQSPSNFEVQEIDPSGVRTPTPKKAVMS